MNVEKWRASLLLAAMIALALPNPSLAQESPPATFEDVAWLIGAWEGRDNEGDRVLERWTAPVGKLMVGTYIQTIRDENGDEAVEWTEFMHLWEDGGTLKLQSFSLLEGTEAVIGPSKLIAIEPCMIQFEEMQMRCADPSKPGAGMIASYGEDDDALGTKKYVITYEKADGD